MHLNSSCKFLASALQQPDSGKARQTEVQAWHILHSFLELPSYLVIVASAPFLFFLNGNKI